MKPTEVYVSGIRFRIRWKTQASISGTTGVAGAYGNYDGGAATIFLAKDVPARVVREAAQHELLHAVFDTSGLNEVPQPLQEETVIKAMSFGLWAVQGDPRNRPFLDWVYA